MSNTQTTSLLDNTAIKAKIDSYLATFFDRKIQQNQNLGQPYATLVSRMKTFTLRGGKRLRPYLCYLGYLAGGAYNEPPIEILAAIELFHTSLLIHDDIMDRDTVRYGGPNITGTYLGDFKVDANHNASSAALLAGDLNIAFVQDLVLSSDIASAKKQYVLSSLAAQYQEVIAGQLLDSIPGSARPTTLDEILNLQEHKTAAYTTIGPLQIGARLAEASKPTLNILRNYAKQLGLLFQTTDDLLGMFGSEVVTGKPSCTDLHEAKPTALFMFATQLCNAEDLALLKSVLGKPHDDAENIAEIRDVLVRSGAKQQTQELTGRLAAQAVASLGDKQGPAWLALQAMPNALAKRTL